MLRRAFFLFYSKPFVDPKIRRCFEGLRADDGEVPFAGAWLHPIAGALTPPSANDNK
jgi:hypothetical protein